MRFFSTLGFVAVIFLPACAQPALSTPPLEFPFQNENGNAIDESWTLGEVTGVTPEHYTVRLDRENSTTSRGSVRFHGNENGIYQALWKTIPLDVNRKTAFMLEYSWDQLLHEENVQSLVWVRIDLGNGMLGMLDNRAFAPTPTMSWQSSTIRAAIPLEADAVTIGVGMFGPGEASFDNLKVQMGVSENPTATSKEATVYVEEFLDIVSSQAMMRENIDWPQMRLDMAALSQGAQSTADTYPALNFCLAGLKDRHSQIMTPEFLKGLAERNRGGHSEDESNADASSTAGLVMPESDRLTGDIGYLWLPGILSFDAAGPQAYASTLARALEDLSDCKGFVIDLRQDGGGNMWPMLAGLGPLLGTEVVGKFQYPNGDAEEWWWRDGWSGQAEIPCTEVIPPHGSSFPSDIPIALLTSRRTGSSGEATLVSFLGRPNTRTFGQATAGLSTGNSSISLSDGALLLLTTSSYADRTGKVYGHEIAPDVEVPTYLANTEDQAMLKAQAWLAEMIGTEQ